MVRMELTPRLPEPVWVDLAMTELSKRLPGLSVDDVAQIVKEHLWTEARDLDPAEAAEIYALEVPPGEAGAPGTS